MNLLSGSDVAAERKGGLGGVHYDYDYPEGLDLRPESKLHKRLQDEVLRRARDSRHKMEDRFPSWDAISDTLTAYIDLSEDEQAIKGDDQRKPVSIVIPVSYATLETLMTYLVAAFLEPPVFRYKPVGPEDTLGALLLEHVVEQQCIRLKAGMRLHTMWRDALSYGFGIASPVWTVRRAKRAAFREETFFSAVRNMFVKNGKREEVEEVVVAEGNSIENIDPYLYMPDPNVPVHEVQKGEYVGWLVRDNLMKLLRWEKDDEDVFNVRYLRHISGESTFFRKERYGDRFGLSGATNPVDLIYMYVDLIPSDWELGDNDYPEKWLIVLAADQVVIQARPVGLDHGLFPVVVTAPDTDGYSVAPVSRLEIIYGMQEAVDWLFNSHVANVRKAINDMLIVDPSLININDLRSPEPGKLIRLHRAAWGRGVDSAVKQLNVQDITRGNIADIGYLADIIQSVSAATDSLQGIIQQRGSRISATEVQGTRVSAISRLEKTAKMIGIQAMQDLGHMIASQTQQLMSQETYVRLMGQWEQVLMEDLGIQPGMYRAGPREISVDFDVVVNDGSVASGEYASLWVQLFQIISSQPLLAQNFDTVRIFTHVARMMGAKNVNDFVQRGGGVTPRVMPDELVAEQAQAGNMVPLEGMEVGGV